MTTITIQSQDIQSNHDWAEDPTQIEVFLERKILEELRGIPSFLEAHNLDFVVRTHCVPYSFFQDSQEHNDEFAEWDPPYSLEGGHLKLTKTGDVIVFFPFKHNPKNEIWMEIGNIETILEDNPCTS